MDYTYLIILIVLLPFLQACPEPLFVHIQNYDSPIIVHSATSDQCNQQPCNQQPCNQQPYNRCNQYETECTCVTKQCGYYQPNNYYPKTASTTGCYSINDGLKPAVYVVDTDKAGLGYGLSYNKCGNKNCLCGKCGGYY